MDLGKLENILKQEPDFRLKQAKQAVFRDLIEDWQKALVLPLSLRQKLAENCSLQIRAKILVSNNGRTVKALITLKDGLKIETVLMRYPDRNTVCLSSMVGCPLKCDFCATGQMGFKRNLTSREIIEQVLFFNRYLNKERQRVGRAVFMGMGEPFLNYDEVMAAIKVINDKDLFNIGARHISISTVGIVEGIERLAKEPLQVNLAISLHAPNDVLRSKIMLVNKKYPLKTVMIAVKNYLAETNRKVMFEYIMINRINDSLDWAQELMKLVASIPKKLFMVNLISYNPTGIFKPSFPERVRQFKKILQEQGIGVTERYRFGRGIKAGCGQLASEEK